MKIKNLLYFVVFTFILGSFAMVSCEGPAGADGLNGEPGVAGNAVCLTCHNTATKTLITDQYDLSGHAAGLYVGYAGGRQGCARCHSHEGYVECQFTGQDTTASADGVLLPTAIGCGTCHDFHATLDFENDGADYALRDNGAQSLIMYDHEVTLDMGNNSNVCAYCHQPRRAYDYDAAAVDSFNISSSHWGPHHGPHATLVYGMGGYEVPGSMSYEADGSTSHFADAGCTTCHMHDGNHSWHPELASCTECHASATSFDVNGVQTEIAGLIQDLEDALVAKGVMEVTDGEAHVVTGKYPPAQVGAFFNYATMVDDRSNGVHNPAYIKALLTNSIESLQ